MARSSDATRLLNELRRLPGVLVLHLNQPLGSNVQRGFLVLLGKTPADHGRRTNGRK